MVQMDIPAAFAFSQLFAWLPLLIDSLFYFGGTAALAFWFHRQQRARQLETEPRVLTSRFVGRER